MTTLQDLSGWINRSETVTDIITATPFAALAATLDEESVRPSQGTALPPLWHWLYFLPIHKQSELGPDGHALRGGFLPPVTRPRRMWAGGQFKFYSPLRIGDRVKRRSTIVSISEKIGRSGGLTFVKVRHDIFCNDASSISMTEYHDIVYKDANKSRGSDTKTIQTIDKSSTWSRKIVPDDVLLFRYSALTFNGHRIHYDRQYATEIEHYPGLIVHGPLIATFLIDLLRENLPERMVLDFEFRAIYPTFDLNPFSVHGLQVDENTIELWACDHERHLTMQAIAHLA